VPSGSLLRIMQASENLAKIVFTLRRNDCCHSYLKFHNQTFYSVACSSSIWNHYHIVQFSRCGFWSLLKPDINTQLFEY
jgi:hypothetical protein